jgi:hypothetical protein
MAKLPSIRSALVAFTTAGVVLSSAATARADDRLRYFGGEVPEGMHVERERDETLIIAGSAGFAVSWGLPAGLASTAGPKDDAAKMLFIPVAGPVIALVEMAHTKEDTLAGDAGKSIALVFATPLFVFDALVQAGSLLAIGLGAAGVGGKDYLVPNEPQLYLGIHRLRLSPSASPDRVGLAVAATF